MVVAEAACLLGWQPGPRAGGKKHTRAVLALAGRRGSVRRALIRGKRACSPPAPACFQEAA